MSTNPPGPVATSTSSTDDLRNAWVWSLVSLVLIVVGMVFGPGEGGSVLLLLGVLILIIAGLVVLGYAARFTWRAVRAGRLAAILPLLLDAWLLFWGLVGILGTFGRFFGWDA